MTNQEIKDRIEELEERARDRFIDSTSGGWGNVLDCLRPSDRKELHRLEHKADGCCYFCKDDDPRDCEYSCVCGEEDDPTCLYCIALEDKTKCPALD